MFAAATTQRLFRDATDETSPRRLNAIRELGRQAMNEDIMACLMAVMRQCRQQPNGMAIEAAKVLAQSGDPRISTVLAQFLDHEFDL